MTAPARRPSQVLPGPDFLKYSFYRFRHTLRRKKYVVVARHNGLYGLLRSHAAKLCKGIRLSESPPVPFHGLDHPQPHDVLLNSGTILITAFIGQILPFGFLPNSLPLLIPFPSETRYRSLCITGRRPHHCLFRRHSPVPVRPLPPILCHELPEAPPRR